MDIGTRVVISPQSEFAFQRDQMGIGVITQILGGDLPFQVRNTINGYANQYAEDDLVVVTDTPAEPAERRRYPVFKKGQRVRIISSTYQPDGDTRRLASKKRQGTIYCRRSRSRGREPSYDVSVVKAAYWGGRETYRYIFNASDLELWEKADG